MEGEYKEIQGNIKSYKGDAVIRQWTDGNSIIEIDRGFGNDHIIMVGSESHGLKTVGVYRGKDSRTKAEVDAKRLMNMDYWDYDVFMDKSNGMVYVYDGDLGKNWTIYPNTDENWSENFTRNINRREKFYTVGEALNFTSRYSFDGYKQMDMKDYNRMFNKSKRKKPITFSRGSTKTPKTSTSTSLGVGRGWHEQSVRHSKASIKGWKNRR